MKIVGCDLRAKQQTIALVDTETGEFLEKTLLHEGNAVGDFYAALEGPVIVSISNDGSEGPETQCSRGFLRRDCERVSNTREPSRPESLRIVCEPPLIVRSTHEQRKRKI